MIRAERSKLREHHRRLSVRVMPPIWLVLTLAACAARSHGAGAPAAAALTPSISAIPTPAPGAPISPLPPDAKDLTITLADAAGTHATVYGRSVKDPATVARIVRDIDGLRVVGSQTRGCSMALVTVRLDITYSASSAELVEDSSCRTAVLTIDGVAGPTLASSLLPEVESILGVVVVLGGDGKPSVVQTAK